MRQHAKIGSAFLFSLSGLALASAIILGLASAPQAMGKTTGGCGCDLEPGWTDLVYEGSPCYLENIDWMPPDPDRYSACYVANQYCTYNSGSGLWICYVEPPAP